MPDKELSVVTCRIIPPISSVGSRNNACRLPPHRVERKIARGHPAEYRPEDHDPDAPLLQCIQSSRRLGCTAKEGGHSRNSMIPTGRLVQRMRQALPPELLPLAAGGGDSRCSRCQAPHHRVRSRVAGSTTAGAAEPRHQRATVGDAADHRRSHPVFRASRTCPTRCPRAARSSPPGIRWATWGRWTCPPGRGASGPSGPSGRRRRSSRNSSRAGGLPAIGITASPSTRIDADHPRRLFIDKGGAVLVSLP
jgi:hypothetical protein